MANTDNDSHKWYEKLGFSIMKILRITTLTAESSENE